PNGTTGMLDEAEIRRDPIEHPLVGTTVPEADAQPQRPGVVVGRISALTPRNAVDGVLNQAGGIGHAIEVSQLDAVETAAVRVGGEPVGRGPELFDFV